MIKKLGKRKLIRDKDVKRGKPKSTAKAALATVALGDLAEANIIAYGEYTIEDRAIPCLWDGLKPVVRRSLYIMQLMGLHPNTAHKKTARVVGDVMGKVHPHGDSSINGAMVRVSTGNGSVVPLIDGQGNWGDYDGASPTYGAAAMRYTECRLTDFADKTLVAKQYMDDEVIPYIPNYDGTEVEPIYLPALIPNTFVNGSFGIATGVSVAMPPYTLDSVIAATQTLFKTNSGKKAAAKLVPTSRWGAKCLVTQEGLDEYHKTGAGRFLWRVPYTIKDGKAATIIAMTGLPIGNQQGFNSLKASIEAIPGVYRCDDMSSKGDILIEIECRTDEAIAKVEAKMTMAETYRSMTTLRERHPNDPERSKVKFLATSPIHMFELWLEWRIALERRLLLSLIRKNDAEIKRLNLLMLAASNLDKLVVIIKAKSGDKIAMIEKALKVNNEDAKTIWGLTVSRLDTVNIIATRERVVALTKENKRYKGEHKEPTERLLASLATIRELKAPMGYANSGSRAKAKTKTKAVA